MIDKLFVKEIDIM